MSKNIFFVKKINRFYSIILLLIFIIIIYLIFLFININKPYFIIKNSSLNYYIIPKDKEGEKVKFSYLKDPNPTGDKVISITNSLPREFELEKYIDYDTQFEKAFLEPLKGVLDVIGWETERKSSLDNFFI